MGFHTILKCITRTFKDDSLFVKNNDVEKDREIDNNIDKEKNINISFRIKKVLPSHCVNCGAPLDSNVCEYCGTRY